MSPQIIILQGGEDVKNRTNESLIRKVNELSRTKRIMVIPWTSDSVEKDAEYSSILRRYFSDNGFQEVLFLKKEDSTTAVSEKFAQVDVVYLPGGDPAVLYEELKKRSLQERLRVFRGIIVGNSAGAIVLSRGAVAIAGDRFYPGFGIVDFFVSVHYTLEAIRTPGADESKTVNIPEGMWIVITGKSENSITSSSQPTHQK